MKHTAKISKKIIPTLLSLVIGAVTSVSLGVALPHMAAAQTNNNAATICAPGTNGSVEKPCGPANQKVGGGGAPTNSPSIVTSIVNPFIKLMTALVGVVIAISIIVGAITYSAAGGDPSKVSAAKKRITNAVIALVAYLFTFGLLQWLVPGGLI